MEEDNEIISKSIYQQQPYRVNAEELLSDLSVMFNDFLSGTVSVVDSNVSIEFTFSNGQKFSITVKEL